MERTPHQVHCQILLLDLAIIHHDHLEKSLQIQVIPLFLLGVPSLIVLQPGALLLVVHSLTHPTPHPLLQTNPWLWRIINLDEEGEVTEVDKGRDVNRVNLGEMASEEKEVSKAEKDHTVIEAIIGCQEILSHPGCQKTETVINLLMILQLQSLRVN